MTGQERSFKQPTYRIQFQADDATRFMILCPNGNTLRLRPLTRDEAVKLADVLNQYTEHNGD